MKNKLTTTLIATFTAGVVYFAGLIGNESEYMIRNGWVYGELSRELSESRNSRDFGEPLVLSEQYRTLIKYRDRVSGEMESPWSFVPWSYLWRLPKPNLESMRN